MGYLQKNNKFEERFAIWYGRETRDFINIRDIIQIVDLIIECGDFDAGIYNVANGQEISVLDLASEILKNLNYKGKLVFSGNERKGDPINWRADISKIISLGYVQQVDIKQGIKNYVRWLSAEKLL